MNQKDTGWIICRIDDMPWIVQDTFSYTRTEAIQKFAKDTSLNWRQWRRRGYQAKRSERIFKIL